MENDTLKSLSETELDKMAREKRLIVMELERRLQTEQRIIEFIDNEMVDRAVNKNAVVLNEEKTIKEEKTNNIQDEEDFGHVGESIY